MPSVHEQRREALKRANDVRTRKAQLKRDLKTGSLTLAEALDHEDLQDWPIGDVVGFACIGKSRYKGNRSPVPAPRLALDLLQAARVGHSRPLSKVTLLERRLILARAHDKEASRNAHRRYAMRRGQRGQGSS